MVLSSKAAFCQCLFSMTERCLSGYFWTTKTYNVCEFEMDGLISVVPSSWMFMDNDGILKCRWTSSQQKIKEAATPSPAWPVYIIAKVMKKKLDSFEMADGYASDAKTTSCSDMDYASHDPANSVLLKRSRKKKISTSNKRRKSNDEFTTPTHRRSGVSPAPTPSRNAVNENGFTTPNHRARTSLPPAPLYRGNSAPRTSTAHEFDVLTPSPQSALTLNALNEIGSDSLSSDEEYTDVFVAKDTDRDASLHSQSTVSFITEPNTVSFTAEEKHHLMAMPGLLEKLLTEQIATRRQVEQLSQEVRELKSAQVQVPPHSAEPSQPSFVPEPPLFNTAEEFEAFCLTLFEKEPKSEFLQQCIFHYGARDVGVVVKKMLKATMTDELQLQYSRKGCDKKNLKKLPDVFQTCILIVLKKYFRDTDLVSAKRGGTIVNIDIRKEMEHQITVYVSNALTRIKGAKKNK